MSVSSAPKNAVRSAFIALSCVVLTGLSFTVTKIPSINRLAPIRMSDDVDKTYSRLQEAADEYFNAMSKRLRGNLLGTAAGEVSPEQHFNRAGPWDEANLGSLMSANKVRH